MYTYIHSYINNYSVNSVTFLSMILLIGDNSVRNEAARLEQLFSIMDFNNANQMSPDELVRFDCM